MDADYFRAFGFIARSRTKTAASLGWLGCGADDPVLLHCGRRTYSKSREADNQHHNYLLHNIDNFRRDGFCAQNRNQLAALNDCTTRRLFIEHRSNEWYGQLSLGRQRFTIQSIK